MIVGLSASLMRSTMAQSRPKRPRPTARAPHQSMRRFTRGAVSRRTLRATMTAAMPMGRLIQKIQRHET